MDQVAQLMEITQRSAQECEGLLDAANGDLDTAVALSFDAPARTAAAPAQPAQAQADPAAARGEPALPPLSLMEELNRDLVSDAAPAGRPPRIIEQRVPLLAALFAPIGYIAGLFAALLARLHLDFRQALPKHPPPLAQRLDEAIGRDRVAIYEGTYAQALAEAKSSLRYLLVILLEWKHQDTGTVLPWLKSEDLQRTLQKQNVLVWAGSLNQPEAYQVALGFRATRYPFAALVGPSPKTSQSNIVVMGVLLKGGLLQFASPADWCHTIEDKCIAHEPKMLALRLDRERSIADRSIRSQQDEAYEQSLARDRERERERERARTDAQRAAENLRAWKAAKRQRFANPVGPTTRVQIRTPAGRTVAKFSESDTLADIYDYVLSHRDPDEGGSSLAYDEGFEPPFDFKLLVPVEKTILPRAATLVKNEPRVWPNGTLIVEPE